MITKKNKYTLNNFFFIKMQFNQKVKQKTIQIKFKIFKIAYNNKISKK